MQEEGKDIDFTNWEWNIMKNIPKQQNDHDCGAYMLTYAEDISRGAELRFTQGMMPHMRQKIALEMLAMEILPPPKTEDNGDRDSGSII